MQNVNYDLHNIVYLMSAIDRLRMPHCMKVFYCFAPHRKRKAIYRFVVNIKRNGLPTANRSFLYDGEFPPYGNRNHYFNASAMATATATVIPTIGLLPAPIRPIISTCAGTEEEPANCASECIRPIVSVIP